MINEVKKGRRRRASSGAHLVARKVVCSRSLADKCGSGQALDSSPTAENSFYQGGKGTERKIKVSVSGQVARPGEREDGER